MATNIKELLSMRQLTVREPSSSRKRERGGRRGRGRAGVLRYSPALASGGNVYVPCCITEDGAAAKCLLGMWSVGPSSRRREKDVYSST